MLNMPLDLDTEQSTVGTLASADRQGATAVSVTGPADQLRRLLRWRPSWFAAAVTAVAAWGIVANLARINYPTLAFDEPFYAEAAWRYVHGDSNYPPTGSLSSFDNFEHPPLAKYLFGVAQLIVGHPSVVADRVVAALCTLGAALVLGVWLGYAAGRWIGLGAAALVAVLPAAVPAVVFRFGRHGYLDPVAELFAVGSLALAWVWFRGYGRAGWWYAVATGVCVGLATACKENGFLGAVGPILVGLLLSARDLRALAERVLQALAAVVAACLVFAATYLSLGHPIDAFRFMLRYQHVHDRLGHRIEFAGRITQHPPGWAFLWFAQHGIGTAISVVCLVCVAAAVLLRHDRLVLWCLAALAGPLIFHMAIARVVLSYYWVMWMPAFLALVALGAGELAGLGAVRVRRPPDLRVAGVVAATVCVTALTAVSAHDTYRMLARPLPPHRTASYSATVLAHSPLVFLRLGDITGAIATDSSGNHRDGVYTNGPKLGVGGLLIDDLSPAVWFNGKNQYLSIPSASWMNAADYSFAVWFRATETSRYLASRDNFHASKVWDLLMDPSGHLRYVTYDPGHGAGQPAVSKGIYNDGKVHLAVCTKSGTTMRLYLDGRLAGSAFYGTFVREPGALGIELARRGNGTGYFPGTLDEFAFYNTVLSAGDVTGLYNAGTRTAAR